MSENKVDVVAIKNEVTTAITPEVAQTLIAGKFEGFSNEQVQSAVLQARLMGFELKDILVGNIYAVSYGGKVQILNSIANARKIGQKSGIVGKSAPSYERDDNGNLIGCTVTVEKMTNGHLGKFTAQVFFGEYTTGKNLWVSKPHSMIAKVAETHALRMACPEEMSQVFIEEEYQQAPIDITPIATEEELEKAKTDLENCVSIDELKKVYDLIQENELLKNHADLVAIKNKMKEDLKALTEPTK